MNYGIENIRDDVKIIYVFGCKEEGKKSADFLITRFKCAKIHFIDNAIENQDGIVYNPKLVDYSRDGVIVYIYSLIHYQNMYNQLVKLGCPDEKIFFSVDILKSEVLQCKEIVKKRTPPQNIDLVYDLVEHCNLNCQNCDHFSNIASPWFADIKDYEKDLLSVRRLFGDGGFVSKLFLAGGEPLLNKDICRFISITHSILEKTGICIFTNGILLKGMNEVFWDTCRKCEVKFYLTRYPINVDYDKLRELIEDNGLECLFQPESAVRTSMHKPLDLFGRQDKYDSFHKCYMGAGVCTTLKHGRIYTCTLIPNLHIFNDFFKKDLRVCEDDYIELDAIDSKEKVLDYICNPVPACRYCKVNEWTYDNEWRISQKSISEWT